MIWSNTLTQWQIFFWNQFSYFTFVPKDFAVFSSSLGVISVEKKEMSVSEKLLSMLSFTEHTYVNLERSCNKGNSLFLPICFNFIFSKTSSFFLLVV